MTVIIGAISLRSIIITAFIHLAMRVWLAKACCCAGGVGTGGVRGAIAAQIFLEIGKIKSGE